MESICSEARNSQGDHTLYPRESWQWLPVARDIDNGCDCRKSACLVKNRMRVVAGHERQNKSERELQGLHENRKSQRYGIKESNRKRRERERDSSEARIT